MAFVDEAKIYAESGKGGDGVVRWAHTKEKARGGPSGGDGGKGGDVVLRRRARLTQHSRTIAMKKNFMRKKAKRERMP